MRAARHAGPKPAARRAASSAAALSGNTSGSSRLDAEELALDDSARRRRRSRRRRRRRTRQRQHLAQHQAHDAAALRAERHADADLARAPRDHERRARRRGRPPPAASRATRSRVDRNESIRSALSRRSSWSSQRAHVGDHEVRVHAPRPARCSSGITWRGIAVRPRVDVRTRRRCACGCRRPSTRTSGAGSCRARSRSGRSRSTPMISMFGVASRPCAIMPPHRVLALQVLAHQRLVDQAALLRRAPVVPGEVAARLDRDPERVEVAGRDGVEEAPGFSSFYAADARDRDLAVPASAREQPRRLAPTAFTPGNAWPGPRSSARKTCRLRPRRTRWPARTPKSTTFSVRKPRSTLRRFWSVRTKSPAPTAAPSRGRPAARPASCAAARGRGAGDRAGLVLERERPARRASPGAPGPTRRRAPSSSVTPRVNSRIRTSGVGRRARGWRGRRAGSRRARARAAR